MKRERFSVEQIAAVLKQAEVGVPVAELIADSGARWAGFRNHPGQPSEMNSGRIPG